MVGTALLLGTLATQATVQPNILWITSEDNGVKWIGCYGGQNAQTPNIDQLATEGFRYLNCYDNTAVCAPTRSSWITGMHAISNGTQPMRSSNRVPDHLKFYNEQLQLAGYYTSNCNKTDYNMSGRDIDAFWDYSGTDYRNTWTDAIAQGKPFFTVLNLSDSHESQAFGDLRSNSGDPDEMVLASYHPDLPEMRETYAIYAGAVEKMDTAVGRAIQALKDDGLYEDTIIVYNSDHGGVLPRSKRFLYSSGIHCPLIIRIPDKWSNLWPTAATNSTVDRIVSFIDMPKTWVSLAGGEIADNFQGTIFLGADTDLDPGYHFGWRGPADQRYDCARVLRGKRYAYHKNYAPFAPNGQYLKYMHFMKGTVAWEDYHKAGNTNEITGRFFEPRPSEEFYDNETDFDNVTNLIDSAEHQATITDLKAELRRQQLAYYDSGLLPEYIRNARASANNMTVYELVRDPTLYPLASYLDQADLALARNPQNLSGFITDLSDDDIGIRYWAVIGLLLLETDAAPAIDELKQLVNDNYTEKNVSPFAAWAIHKAGDTAFAEEYLYQAAVQHPDSKVLVNILDWMGEAGVPILTRIAQSVTLTENPAPPVLREIVIRAGIEIPEEPEPEPEPEPEVPVVTLSAIVSGVTDGLFGYWAFDEGSGTSTADYTGYNDGTISGATWETVNGKFGNALSFDGNDYVLLGDGPSDPTLSGTDMTISLWATSDGMVSNGNLIGNRDSWSDMQFQFSYRDNASSLTIQRDGSNNTTFGYNPNTDTNYHHYILTFTSPAVGEAGTATLYVDGQLISSMTYTMGALPDVKKLTIGASQGGEKEPWKGDIDDVAIWSRALSSNEVAIIYNAGTPVSQIPPYSFNDWASANGLDGSVGRESGMSDNPDGDGLDNLAEYALAGHPLDPNDGAKFFVMSNPDGGDPVTEKICFTVAVLAGVPIFSGSPSLSSSLNGFTYTSEGSLDLIDFTTPIVAVDPVSTDLAPLPANYEYRSFSMDDTGGSPDRGFLRVKVTQDNP
jgi:arylsulfatase A-like enzyme